MVQLIKLWGEGLWDVKWASNSQEEGWEARARLVRAPKEADEEAGGG